MPSHGAQEDTSLAELERTRCKVETLVDVPSSGGVYAIYLRSSGLLAPFPEGEGGLIYVGLSTNLEAREFECHFASGNTGFSTLRRSIGAILKRQLDLKAIPRSSGPSETNVRNYRFDTAGDDRLTEWMCEHLEVGIRASARYLELEDFLIAKLRPLLNLKKWSNPNAAQIKSLRRACADEARVARQASTQR